MKSVKPVSDAITAPVLLLVEGEDEKNLVQWMCEHWFGLGAQAIDIENVQGRDNFQNRFKALKVRSLGLLKVVGVIADSKEDPEATAQRWSDLFDDVIPVINRPCRKLQLPKDDVPGAFEALMLEALDGDVVADCATRFRDCVTPHLGDRTLAQRDKIAVQAWLSAKLGSAYGNVFSAQKKNPKQTLLDYDHPAFTTIKVFIEGLLAETQTIAN